MHVCKSAENKEQAIDLIQREEREKKERKKESFFVRFSFDISFYPVYLICKTRLRLCQTGYLCSQ